MQLMSFKTVFYLSIVQKAYCLVSNNRSITTSLHGGWKNAENRGSNGLSLRVMYKEDTCNVSFITVVVRAFIRLLVTSLL